MANTMSDAQNFVKWCRSERGVKSISELNDGHYVSYLAYLSEKGFKERSKRFENNSFTLVKFCPERRLKTSLGGSDVKNRSYTEEEVRLIRGNCSDEVTKAVDLMREMSNDKGSSFVVTA